MKQMPSRDLTGKCEGECRNLVREGEEKRQKEIKRHEYSTASSPNLPWANIRTEAPGFYGGHV